MKRCPITYEEIGQRDLYSARGLKKLSRKLARLDPLPFTAQELRMEAAARAEKMSIQGVQPKLSAVLKIKEGRFEIVDIGGTYILKPQCDFPELPQNEAITMSMAAECGIEVPAHGLLYSKDGSFTYFIRRFDRAGRSGKLHLEDFAQLSGGNRETKYASSMERVAKVIEDFCTFPLVEKAKLFRILMFCFISGNEDMHLKNFSLIERDGKIELSPAYDLVNSFIALPKASEELALPLNGKKRNLTRSDLCDYFGMQRLGLNARIIDQVLGGLATALPRMRELIAISFLSDAMNERYKRLLDERAGLLEL
ncbi:MAG: HipA domain-containing protein [Desulfobaccales bacterium]